MRTCACGWKFIVSMLLLLLLLLLLLMPSSSSLSSLSLLLSSSPSGLPKPVYFLLQILPTQQMSLALD